MVECKNAIFCPSWGERKCIKLNKRIHNPNVECGEKCKHYSTGTNDTECRCETCLEQQANMEDDLK